MLLLGIQLVPIKSQNLSPNNPTRSSMHSSMMLS